MKNNFEYNISKFNKDTDKESLFNLIKICYPNSYNLIIDRWNWQFLQNPFSSEINIIIAKENNKVVGQLALIPAIFSIHGERYKGVWHSNSMVHPSYRKQGIVSKLLQYVNENYPINIAKTTSPNMLLARIKNGYKEIKPSRHLLHIIDYNYYIKQKESFLNRSRFLSKIINKALNVKTKKYKTIKEIDYFDKRYDELCDTMINQFKYLHVRDANYLNWRYFDCSTTKYKVFEKSSHNYELKGAIITKINRENDLLKGWICDLVIDISDKKVVNELIIHALTYFKSKNVKVVYSHQTEKKLKRIFYKYKFFPARKELVTIFNQTDLPTNIYNAKNWVITRGDSDSDLYD